MPLSAGSRLGPYQILSSLGAGGMGEVYRARDSRLGREVAVKIIAPQARSDPRRLRRFEDEARAASALNHPNVLSVLDVGAEADVPYVVFELLQGETLRDKLRTGPLPARKAVDYAVQVCQGLTAAHGNGIVHRDLKPENLFLTRDGRVKILDFGLARLGGSEGEDERSSQLPTATEPGRLLGTFSYMSPEQARGEPADARSDIFGLGAVVYEMLSGRPAFRRASAAQTLAAVLNQEPSELGTSDDPPMPGGLVHIVRRCLEKSPDERFQSASDLAFALSNLSGSSPGASGQSAAARRGKRWIVTGALAFLMAALPVAGYLFGKWQWERPVTSFHRLTFRRGTNWGARFAPDGQTIVYAAVWDGGPMRLFSTRVDSPESRTMDVADGDVLGISSAGELALCLRRSVRSFPGYTAGTLARMPLAGGAPREILENVLAADWSADGNEIAVTRSVNGHSVLEFPIGRVLVDTDRVLLSPRVSPKGDVIAFVESDERGDEYRAVSIVDRSGARRVLTTGWRWMNSLAWSPHGEEVWFAASQAGPNCSLWAVTRSGRVRLLARFPSFALLQDVSSDGRVLIAFGDARSGITASPRGENRQRDLSWFDLSVANAISIDGRVIVGTESGEGTKRRRAIFLRRTDGASPPVRLGDGFALALSPDSRWLLSRSQDRSGELVLLPTGPGGAKTFPGKGIEYEAPASWAAGGDRILVTGRQGTRPWRSLLLDLEGRATVITPEGVVATAISPAGDRVAARDSSGKMLIYRLGGGDPQVAPGPPEPGDVGPWSSDGRSIFTTVTDGLAVRVFRRDLVTGRREAITEFLPADPAGMVFVSPVVSADGRSCAYNFAQLLSSLYLVEGLR